MRLLRWLFARWKLKQTLFLMECQIHGSHYYDCFKVLKSKQLKQGQMLLLRREPDNEYDSSAVEVLTTRKKKLGYLPKHLNRVIATLMDQNCQVHAVIVLIDSQAWEPVTIQVFLQNT